MRRKVVATVEIEFEVEDATHLLSFPEWTKATKPNLRQLVENAVRMGLTEQRTEPAPVVAVNHVMVIDFSASPS